MGELTHLDEQGLPRMVDVGAKAVTRRRAVAAATLAVGEEIMQTLQQGGRTPKGNALEVARLAGIGAAKRTAELIPLCHQVPLDHVSVDFRLAGEAIHIRGEVTATAKTGVEMEALAAVAVAGLTLYDMLKALGKGMVLQDLRLLRKEGGTSGLWEREDEHGW